MCLHFGLVATNVLDIVSFTKHFVFTSVGQDQIFFPRPFLFKLSIHTTIGCLKGEKKLYVLFFRANSFVAEERIKHKF